MKRFLNPLLKRTPSLMTLFLLLALLLGGSGLNGINASGTYPVSTLQPSRSNVLRLHIVANSDSKEDQALKLKVRDAVLDFERSLFESPVFSPRTARETRALIMRNGAGLYRSVEETLLSSNADYSATLRIGESSFPDRTYSGTLYPAGGYQALKIVLGDGQGKNWWCVMFPPLCILETDPGQSEGEAPPSENAQAPEFKSLIEEFIDWLGSLFSGE